MGSINFDLSSRKHEKNPQFERQRRRSKDQPLASKAQELKKNRGLNYTDDYWKNSLMK